MDLGLGKRELRSAYHPRPPPLPKRRQLAQGQPVQPDAMAGRPLEADRWPARIRQLPSPFWIVTPQARRPSKRQATDRALTQASDSAAARGQQE